jgi:PAS domain S-box-containing protein
LLFRETSAVSGETQDPDPGTPAEAEDALRRMAEFAPLPFPTPDEVLAAQPGDLIPLTTPRTTLPEAQYQTLVEQIPAVTFMASFENGLREVYVSPQIKSLLGYTQEEWLQRPQLWLERLHPDDRERWHADFAPLVWQGAPFRGEYRFLARDGSVVWLLGDARIVRDDAGQPLFVQGVGFDITELKRTEEELRRRTGELEVANRERREAEEALREIASTIRETFWVLGPALDRIAYASPAFESIWGRPIDALRHSPAAILEVVHPLDRERVSRLFERMRSEETEIEHRVVRPGGGVRWVRSRTFPVRNAEKSVVRVIAVTEDVTERKELEVQIQQAQQREIVRLRSEVQKESAPEDLLVGSSEPMRRLRALLRKVASSEATVLITGESGTGKELVARALHYGGPRAARPLVDVNCAAFTEGMPESELFGHEKGSYTGATAQHAGKFEQAHGGTLFLDEIGDMPAAIQAKILRALQERSFERVGGKEKVRVDVRVICATNRGLEEEVEKGAFRADLYYRINTMVIEVPPLRERASDIPELAAHFLAKANRNEKRQVEISEEAMALLRAHRWPGNVRELKHAVEHAVLICDEDVIRPRDLPPAVARRAAAALAPMEKEGLAGCVESVGRPLIVGELEKAGKVRLFEVVESVERTLIVAALDKCGWVKSHAAKTLGLNERVLSYKMNNLGIEKAAV